MNPTNITERIIQEEISADRIPPMVQIEPFVWVDKYYAFSVPNAESVRSALIRIFMRDRIDFEFVENSNTLRFIYIVNSQFGVGTVNFFAKNDGSFLVEIRRISNDDSPFNFVNFYSQLYSELAPFNPSPFTGRVPQQTLEMPPYPQRESSEQLDAMFRESLRPIFTMMRSSFADVEKEALHSLFSLLTDDNNMRSYVLRNPVPAVDSHPQRSFIELMLQKALQDIDSNSRYAVSILHTLRTLSTGRDLELFHRDMAIANAPEILRSVINLKDTLISRATKRLCRELLA